MRRAPADFEVVEELGFTPSGDGEHDYLFVEKTARTTREAARELARHAGVADKVVGYAGMKDRNARTRQWFSVQRRPGTEVDWDSFDRAGLAVIEATRHGRKLKRGAHRRNRFRIVLRDVAEEACVRGVASLEERLARLGRDGAPNYFGEQRFGRDGGNLALAERLFDGRRLRRSERSIALSAARSAIFNDVLSARVAAGTWDRLLPGDVAGLDGTGSVFPVADVDDELRGRCRELDIHPTGPLWGRGAPATGGRPALLERDAAAGRAGLATGLEAMTAAARRPLRVAVRDLEWHVEGTSLTLRFSLDRGSFATAILRELVVYPI